MCRTDGHRPAWGLVPAWSVSDALQERGKGDMTVPARNGDGDPLGRKIEKEKGIGGGLPCRKSHGHSFIGRNAIVNLSRRRNPPKKVGV